MQCGAIKNRPPQNNDMTNLFISFSKRFKISAFSCEQWISVYTIPKWNKLYERLSF